MLHACVERFDVMGERGNILGWDGEVNMAEEYSNRIPLPPWLLFFFFLKPLSICTRIF
jgi:hypothetical protein